ncbi:MAG: SH3 domain-containing protein, partial [Steroidobacteraceae bacterium]
MTASFRVLARSLIVLLLIGSALAPRTAAAAEDEYLQLFVTEPYLELHLGPGRGYPVVQVIPRGDAFDVL